MHYFMPDYKRQSVEFLYKILSAQEKFRQGASIGKIMLPVLWDVEGMVHSELMPIGLL